MHRILLRTVVLDFAPDVHDAGRDFWATALGATAGPPGSEPEYSWLQDPASPAHLLVQRLEQGPSRVHLDLESDDMESEIARLERAGAQRIQRFERWQVMRDPAGMYFCVIPPQSEDFAERARTIED